MDRKRTRVAVVVVCALAAAGAAVVAVLWLFGMLESLVAKRPAGPPPPDLKNARTLDRPGFTLQYPGNWKIDTADPDYDPDRNFTITSEGGSQISFLLYDTPGLPPQVTLDAFVGARLQAVMKNATRQEFTRWGRYEGSGAEVKGRLKDVLLVTIRVFTCSDSQRSFVANAMMYNEDRATVEPGLALIESTFRLKP